MSVEPEKPPLPPLILPADRPAEAPLISAGVVNWNRRELLEKCLDSLSRQTYPRFEVIVVDNGSTDGSVDLVNGRAPGFPVPLRLIVNSNNLGFCAANNQGFAKAEGSLIALLNNDAEADPNWL